MIWSLRPTRAEDVPNIAPRLRKDDLNEWYAASGVDPMLSLSLVADRSQTFAGMDDEPLAILGVDPVSEVAAAVWMIVSEDAVKAPYLREFIRNSRPLVEGVNAKHPLLFNYVDARNTLHLRWLKWCGFIFIKKHEHYGFEKRPFIEFVRISPCATQHQSS